MQKKKTNKKKIYFYLIKNNGGVLAVKFIYLALISIGI